MVLKITVLLGATHDTVTLLTEAMNQMTNNVFELSFRQIAEISHEMGENLSSKYILGSFSKTSQRWMHPPLASLIPLQNITAAYLFYLLNLFKSFSYLLLQSFVKCKHLNCGPHQHLFVPISNHLNLYLNLPQCLYVIYISRQLEK